MRKEIESLEREECKNPSPKDDFDSQNFGDQHCSGLLNCCLCRCLSRIKFFFTAPIVKFYLNLYFYLIFLGILSISIITTYNLQLSDNITILLLVWIISFVCEEIFLIYAEEQYKFSPIYEKVYFFVSQNRPFYFEEN